MNTLQYDVEFEALLNGVKQICGYNLTAYKRGTLMRRFQYRMQQLGIENYGNYLEYLQQNSQECVELINTVLINNSCFFRDYDYWEYLASTIIPQIIANKNSDQRIRVWSAGCACGQEAYTLVMLLAEALGIEQYLQRVQIFATDIDEDALTQARQGSYSKNEITGAGIPTYLVSKYFEQTKQRYVFHSKLRQSIVFSHHDLVVNAPISKIDLLVCRNVLIYFQPESQATILMRFHMALNDDGFLFLGNAESVTSSRQIFTPISLKHRVFTKGKNLSLEDYVLLRRQTRGKKAVTPITLQIPTWQAAFGTSPFAQLAIDSSNHLLVANKQAYMLFGLTDNDIGARLQNLKMGQVVDSWTFIRQLSLNCYPLNRKNIEWVSEQSTIYLDIHVLPILDPSGRLLGINLTFIKLPDNHKTR